jgi:hypothetical protein
MRPLDQLQSSDFSSHLNETFSIHLEGQEPVDLELVSVIATSPQFHPGARQPFSVSFLGPVSSTYLLQHIYPLEHQQLGRLELFLVPLGPEEGRMRYEAIFS